MESVIIALFAAAVGVDYVCLVNIFTKAQAPSPFVDRNALRRSPETQFAQISQTVFPRAGTCIRLSQSTLTLDTVPEPASMALLGWGRAGFGWMRRRWTA